MTSPTTPSGSRVPASPAALEELASRWARAAGDLARRRTAELVAADGSLGSRSKSSATDPVTVVDTEVEDFLVARIRAERPGDGILGEEGGERASPGAGGVDERLTGLTWVLDPIDGTVNLLYGIAFHAVSVGVRSADGTVAGAVHVVGTGETYSAHRGGGARLADPDGAVRELRASGCTDPARALVGTGFSYSAEIRVEQGRAVAELLPRVRDIRRCGAAAIDLCMVAAGRLDAYYERCLKPWDVAAGGLVAAEAGAWVALSGGGPGGGEMDDAVATVAAAPGLATAFPALLERCGVRVATR